MSGIADRRARLLRLRTIESRIATIRLATADAAVASLNRIDERLLALRAELVTMAGETRGAALNMMAEMSQRLDAARAGIAAPMSDADAQHADMHSRRIKARQKEDSAERLHGKALHIEVSESIHRADANRPYRKRQLHLDSLA
jgi:hypothetical protein